MQLRTHLSFLFYLDRRDSILNTKRESNSFDIYIFAYMYPLSAYLLILLSSSRALANIAYRKKNNNGVVANDMQSREEQEPRNEGKSLDKARLAVTRCTREVRYHRLHNFFFPFLVRAATRRAGECAPKAGGASLVNTQLIGERGSSE